MATKMYDVKYIVYRLQSVVQLKKYKLFQTHDRKTLNLICFFTAKRTLCNTCFKKNL